MECLVSQRRWTLIERIKYHTCEPRSFPHRQARLLRIVGVLLLSGLLVVGTAKADVKSRIDPDDSSSQLDIKSIEQRHGGRGLLVHRITTFEEWDASTLSEPENSFELSLQYRGHYRFIHIDVADDGSLFAEINHPTKGAVLGYAKIWRPDTRTVQIEIPKRLLSSEVQGYKWNAQSSFHDEASEDCSNDNDGHVLICNDTAPDSGWVYHRLGNR